MLVGSMFGLRTLRPRLFECSFDVPFVLAPPANAGHAKMGRPPQEGEYVHVVGHMSNVAYCGDAIGIDWMVQRAELVGGCSSQAYTTLCRLGINGGAQWLITAPTCGVTADGRPRGAPTRCAIAAYLAYTADPVMEPRPTLR